MKHDRQTSDRLQALLPRLKGMKHTGPNRWQAFCPAHEEHPEGHKPSLSVTTSADGTIAMYCHGGCSTRDVLRTMGLTFKDLQPPGRRLQQENCRRQIVSTYDYRDAKGNLLFQTVRYEPKDFRQRRPDGKGGWIWNLGDTPRVLYRLPDLLAADPKEPVFIPEGEKDADNVANLELVATTCPMGAKKWTKLSDDAPLHGRCVVILPDKDAAGRQHAEQVARSLCSKAAEVRILELPGEGKDVSDWIESLDCRSPQELRKSLLEMAATAPVYEPPDSSAQRGDGARPTVLIDTEEHRAVTETIAALVADPDIYQRGGILVRVLRDAQPQDGLIQWPAGSPTIRALPAANLRDRMTRFATFARLNRNDEEVPAHPATWLVGAIEARADWPGIRHLFGVSDAPVLRPDGSVWQTPGYDDRTGVLLESGMTFPEVNPEASIDDAVAGLGALLEIVCDFPFASKEHQAAWVAALLTPLARFAFEGPSPLFLIEANVMGAGKSLLVQAIARIALGREIPVSSYAHDKEEMRKRITAIAISGDRMILLDNLGYSFGNGPLDRALTSTRWKDRILGRSEEIDLPLMAVWYATGNNLSVAADTARRIIHIRLDVLEEKPEERTGFRHPNLLAWIGENRACLLSAALTVLSAFCRADRPTQDLKPFGSFEGWSDLVRQAVVWVGLPDPCLTRMKLAESVDTTADALSQLLAAWRQYCGADGTAVSELLAALYPQRQELFPTDQFSAAMRVALENLAACSGGRPPTARQVGNRLRRFRRRVLDGMYLDIDPHGGRKNGAVWRLCSASGDTIGDSGESGESVTVPLARSEQREEGDNIHV